MTSIVSALTRRWVTFYTGGMDTADRDERRSEIESDLWDHEATNAEFGVPSFVTAIEMFGRWLFGIPADISWRYERDSSNVAERRDLQRSSTMMVKFADRGLTILALVLAGLLIVPASLVVTFAAGDLSDGIRVLVGLTWIPTGLVLLCGVYLSDRSPWFSAWLISMGAIAAGFVMFFFFYVIVPVALALIGLSVMRARRLSPGNTSAPAG